MAHVVMKPEIWPGMLDLGFFLLSFIQVGPIVPKIRRIKGRSKLREWAGVTDNPVPCSPGVE